ncbi:MAG: SagB/ThcOx family dehydrogenase [Sutterellaceae bacterium]|nr:SagB/ThcOx family dehydrogenase [Sutterellaceae bacterium]
MSEVKRQLPPPIEMQMPLVQVLGRRRSSREFAPQDVDASILSAVLWACAGQTLPDGHRTVPSALDSREVQAYVFDRLGVWRYDPADNTLVETNRGDQRGATTEIQPFVAKAPVTIMMIADKKRADKRMKGEGLKTMMAVDAGCMVQAAQMACTAMGLASVPRASFDPVKVRNAAGLNDDHVPLMAVTIGFGA